MATGLGRAVATGWWASRWGFVARLAALGLVAAVGSLWLFVMGVDAIGRLHESEAAMRTRGFAPGRAYVVGRPGDLLVGRSAAGGPAPGGECRVGRGVPLVVVGLDADLGVLAEVRATPGVGPGDCAAGTLGYAGLDDAGRDWVPEAVAREGGARLVATTERLAAAAGR